MTADAGLGISMFGCAVVEQIHAGPRSHVYRGLREADASRVIIKVPTGRSRAEQVRGLQGEAAALERLSGVPGVARSHGLVRDGESQALLFDDAGGASVRRLGLAGQIEPRAFLEVALAVVDVLDAIHGRGVIHRNLSPDHIVLCPEAARVELVGLSGALVIEDVYGPGGLADAPEAGFEQTYTSPEQTGRSSRGVDFRSDYYLLGVSLFELLTGAPPFQSLDPLKLVHAHLARTPPDPRQARADVSASLSNVLLTLLAKDADDRYQSAKALRRDLSRCLDEGTAGVSRVRVDSSPPSAVRFKLPEALYGRETHRSALLSALERASAGVPVVAMLSGLAGVGKSALGAQLIEAVVARGGRTLVGRFEADQAPYAGLGQALESLGNAVRARPWAGEALAALGEAVGEFSTSVLSDFCPALESLFGPQPSARPLPPQQAGVRLSQALGRLLRALAEAEPPLCLFLDDLQWAGSDALRLLEDLLSGELRGQILVVLAYRPPLADAPDVVSELALRLGASLDVRRVHLSDLTPTDVRSIARDALSLEPERLDPFARLVYARTRGNPFFVRSFIAALVADGSLERGAEGWDYDLSQLSQRGVTDNVVELLVRRIERLPKPTQDVLKVAALLGMRFQLARLTHVAGPSAALELERALDAELLLGASGRTGARGNSPPSDTLWQFAHERVQKAVLCLLDDATARALHREIGWRLSTEAAAGDGRERLLFDIVRHLNQAGLEHGPSSERLEVAALDLEASRLALGQGAGALALALAQSGCTVLGEEGWALDYPLTWALHLTAAEAAFTWADHDAFGVIAARALAAARTPLDTAAILRLRGRVYQAQSRPKEALGTYLVALERLGISLAAEPTPADVRAARAELSVLLGQHDDASLLELPACRDSTALLAMELLSKLVFFAYASASPLLAIAVTRLVALSLAHGNGSESANGYTFYGRLLAAEHDFDGACRFGQLALDLAHRFHDPVMLSQTYLYANWELMHWKATPHELCASFEKAVEYGLQAGSPVNAACSATTLSICRMWAGDRLSRLGRAMAKQRPMVQQFRQQLVLEWHDSLAQAIENLRGTPGEPALMRGPLYAEAERLPKNESSPSARFNFYVWKTLLCYLFDDIPAALATSRLNDPLKPTFTPALWAVPVMFLDSLCLLGAAALASGAERASLLAEVETLRAALVRLAVHNPAVVRPKLLTVSAELAHVRGEASEAEALYSEALAAADENPVPCERGVAYELGARFSLSRGDRVAARRRMKAAARAFFRWGAFAKVRALERRYPELLPPTFPDVGTVNQRSTEPQEFDTLDLLSVLNASRTISGELEQDKLLARLMMLLIENAGAELGYILRQRQAGWVVDAGQSAEQGTFTLLEAIPMAELAARGLPALPASVVERVASTGVELLLDDARGSAEFARDPVIMGRQTASLLCFPMQRAGVLVAIVYLENNLGRGAFTQSGLGILEMLSMQAVISLENATLYASLEQKVEERTRELSLKNDELQGALARIVEVQRQMVSQEKLAELGALAAGIAHEIKNPLNFVTNFAVVASSLAEEIEEVLAGPQPAAATSGLSPALAQLVESFKQTTDKIREHGARATGIVNGMALHARAGGAQFELVELNYLLGQSLVLAAHGLATERLKIDVVTQFDDAVGSVEVVVQDISRVVVNLISNARYSVEQKHKRGVAFSPCISISSRSRGDQAEIRVRDNGVGVPLAMRERIFLPFFTTKPAGAGTGLGLSISHEIVARGHHGQLTVESTDGEHAEFIIVLPRRQPGKANA